jgi:hypothetical protein
MRFEALPRAFPEQPIWGARSRALTFIITQDEPDGYTASAKVVGALPFDRSRLDLGGYCAHRTFAAAVDACKKFAKQRHA